MFEDIDSRPVASLLQDFSAPVRLEFSVDDAELAFRIAHEHDAFNRFDAAQVLGERILLAAYRDGALEPTASLQVLLGRLAQLVADTQLDPALVAECLEPPDEIILGERIDALDPTRLHGLREQLRAAIGQHLASSLLARRDALAATARGGYAAPATAARRFRQRALQLLMSADPVAHAAVAQRQYAEAAAMGERLAALAALMHHAVPGAQALAEAFHRQHADDALLIDKWLMLQATNPQPGTLERVHALLDHAAFSLRNPNKVRALLGSFARQNRARFHDAGGGGYRPDRRAAGRTRCHQPADRRTPGRRVQRLAPPRTRPRRNDARRTRTPRQRARPLPRQQRNRGAGVGGVRTADARPRQDAIRVSSDRDLRAALG